MKVARSVFCSEGDAVSTGIEGMYLKLGKRKAEAVVGEVVEGAIDVAVVRTLLNGLDVLARDHIIVEVCWRCLVRIHQGKAHHDLVDASFLAGDFPSLRSRHLHQCDSSNPAALCRREAAVYRQPLSRLTLVHGRLVDPLAWRAWMGNRSLARGMISSPGMAVGYPGARAVGYCGLGWWIAGVYFDMSVRSSRARRTAGLLVAISSHKCVQVTIKNVKIN